MSAVQLPRLVHRRVAFVMPPTGTYCREDRCQSSFRFELVPSLRAPLEEAEAAGAVRAAGGEALVLDAPAARLDASEVRRRLEDFGPDLIVVVTTFGTLDDDLRWASVESERFDHAVFGVRGAPAYTHAAEILERAPGVAFCVRGDYEVVFDGLVREGLDSPGVVTRGAHGPVERGAPRPDDLDALPWPDRSSLDAGLYRVRGLGAPQATVRVQRGCPYPCSYCLVHTVSGAKARHRSPRSVAEEMAQLRAQGFRWFYLRAETFSLDREWTFATCAAIARRVPDARWVTTTRVECVDDDLVAAMAAAGCYGISFGIDVASRTIGEKVGKPPRPGRAWEAMRACDRHGVLSLGYFMIGFAWETEETLAETAAFARSARPDLLTVHFAHPYPGTRYHEDVQALGRRFHPRDAQAAPALEDAAITPSRLRRASRAMLTRHYADPRVLLSCGRKLGPLVAESVRDRFLGGIRPAATEPTPSSARPR